MADYSVVLVARAPNMAAPPTFTELGPLLPTSFSYGNVLNGSGSFEGTTNVKAINDDVKTRLRDPLNFPSEVWVYRNSDIVWAGPVMGVKVANEIITINASGLLAYIDYMIIPSDKTFSATEQFEIAAELIDDWQNLDYGDFGLDVTEYLPPGATTSGVTRDLMVLGQEKHQVSAIIGNFIGLDNGFDWYAEPDTRNIKFANPSQGSDLTASVYIEQGIEQSEVALSVAPSVIASEAFGVGTGGASPLSSTLANTSLRSAFGRVGAVVAVDGAVDQSTLDDVTQGFLDNRQTALVVPGGTIKPTPEADVTSFGIGDLVNWSHDPGLGAITGQYRVALKKVNVDQGGTERMEVKFV